MDVTQRSSWGVDGDSLVTGQDVQPLIEHVLTFARDSITAGVRHCPDHTPAGDDHSVVPTPDQLAATREWVGPELERLKEQAEGGDACSARRVAELFELINDLDQANDWWYRAARLGDLDAVEYVQVILGR